ncbi:DNA-3-methyladenine glycosylase I [Leptospira sp. FAT2]|uniref:DNA-3-methyladenine glycosylase I n=1 Tax=Leptospira sanjuanensis TaxID=2879643 RepID=UPI001EE8F519|nr:DNA-3-methyladenine glycosylase I [Leptospira sanjuanensis]MCG6194709.1 DNA-3-methyladenine glycosylase I [Leptospira sanjuanensis]
MNQKVTRCTWASKDPLYIDYHDLEWGTPVHDDRTLFEFLILEGAQAGLSWITILKKRDNYRKAFDYFDPEKVAAYSEKKIRSLMKDEGIVRNELKIRSTIENAKEFLNIQKEYDSFDKYIWGFVDHKTIHNSWKTTRDVPSKTVESDAMSKALKKRGFKFVGSTICYAFMQATGMVMDHTTDCFRYEKKPKK